jgi:uncharacterized protein (UPF0333 family)
MFNDNRAQGSLEYLIIVAAVLAIGAIVILFLTQSASSGSTSALVAECQSAASKCATTMMTSGLADCSALTTCNACNTSAVTALSGKITTTDTSVYATAYDACIVGATNAIIAS